MLLNDVESLINIHWEDYRLTKKILLRSFKRFDLDIKFYFNSRVPDLYARDYIVRAGRDPVINLYPLEIVIEKTLQGRIFDKPALLIGDSNFYFHYYSLSIGQYFSLLKENLEMEAFHFDMLALSRYITPIDSGYIDPDDREDFDEEE